MQPCPVPEPGALKTNAALQDWTISLVEALRACDADKTGLRQWSQAGPEEAPVQ